MSNQVGARHVRRIALLIAALGAAGSLSTPARLHAQRTRQAALQIEVRDSIGLPLPDAKVEVFTFMEGGVFWEWIPVDSTALPEGINLLRFSNPGFRSTLFSVPVRDATTLSLRVRLDPQQDTTKTSDVLQAQPVRAMAVVAEGRAHTDVMGRRRVIEHKALERESVTGFGPLMRRARNTELRVLPASGGSFRVFSQSAGGSYSCPMQVMVNGDRKRVLPFEVFDRMFSITEVEAIEIFPMGSSVPLSYQLPRAGCGLMVVWFRIL